VAEVIDSRGCHSGHVNGQKLIFDNSGNLFTKENPDRVCSFMIPNLTILINVFFENLLNGRDPNEVMFNTTGCFDTSPSCGGWGHVVVRMSAVKNRNDLKKMVFYVSRDAVHVATDPTSINQQKILDLLQEIYE
jgi:hypothetical protein